TSWTGRPSRPPLVFTSSAQIWMAISAALPLPARPPVSAMPKPILIGSAAAAGHAAANNNIVAAAQPIAAALIVRNTGFSISSLPVAPAFRPGVLCRILRRGNVPPARAASVAEEARLDQPARERADGAAMD